MPTSSAEPEKLFRCADAGIALDSEVKSESARLAGSLAHFESACRESGYRLSVGHLAKALSSYGAQCETVNGWVRRVGAGFVAADSGGFGASPLQIGRWWPWRSTLGVVVWIPIIGILPVPSWLGSIVRTLPWLDPRPTPVPTPTPSPEPPALVGHQPGSVFGLPTGKKLENSKYLQFGAIYQDGPYARKSHKGVDVDGTEGEEIHPIGAGIVVECRTQKDKESGYGWGHTIVIKHTLSDGTAIYSRYAHLQELPDLELDEPVDASSVIGKMGNSGTELVHLHLEISRSYPATDWIDPASVIGNPEWQVQT